MSIAPDNIFLVGANGRGEIMIGRVITHPISRAAALNLAAWIVALADRDDEFPALLKAVKET